MGLINSLDKETLNTISKSDALNSLDVEFEVDNNVNPEDNESIQTSEIISIFNENQTSDSFKEKETKLFSDIDILKNIIISKLIKLSGSVVSPGYYPIGGTANINSIISIAGGYSSDADSERIEIQRIDLNKIINNTNFAEPGDTVYVHSSNLIKNNIKIIGSIEVARQIGYQENLYLGDIINDLNDFEDETYLHFAVVNRKKTKDKSKKLLAFSPEK